MDQQQIKVTFSVGTKLLLSIGLLLFFVILFLILSNIYVFREDKRAYIYKTQSTEAILAGREFMSLGKESIETLKRLLAAVDPSKPMDRVQSENLQSSLDNQADVLMASFYVVNRAAADVRLVGRVTKAKEMAAAELDPKDYEISREEFARILPELVKNRYSFLNRTKPGADPTLVVLFADLNFQNDPKGMPVAVGLVSLKSFGHELQSLNVTIGTVSGRILYDTDVTALSSKGGLNSNPLFQAAASSSVENGAMEYDYNGTHYLGSYLNPGLGVVVMAKIEWEKAMKATYTLIEKCILLGIMAIGVGVIFAILFSKTLTAPIGRLYEATREVAKGNFELLLSEKGRDEISALSKSFNIMSQKIGELIKESIQKVHLENEMAIASTVQQNLIPPPEFQNDWLQIRSHYRAADQCGGDWWGFFGVGHKVAIMIADATGHGLPSALMTASARSCFSVMHKWAKEDPDFSFSPSAMLSFANRVIYDGSMGKIMMTFFIAVIDGEKGTLTYSSAGHNPPWLFKKSGEGRHSLVSLTSPGQRLGEVQENDTFEEKTVEIAASDVLFLYTDGLTEGKNAEGEMYGKKNVRKVVEASLAGGPATVISNVMKEFMNHNGAKPLDDDVTVTAAMLLRKG